MKEQMERLKDEAARARVCNIRLIAARRRAFMTGRV